MLGDSAILTVKNLNAWYDECHVLHGVNMEVYEGEVVTLLGRNGAGKTTTIKSLIGLVQRRKGSIRVRGAEVIDRRPDQIAKCGLALCPEERAIFPSLNVLENLMLPPVLQPGGLDLEAIYKLFPNLKLRSASMGTKLSGGEQQMLAIARILRTGAKLLLLDEPTEGLAPVVVQQIANTISEIKSRGFTIVLVEQNFQFASLLGDRHYVMEEGRIVDMIERQDVKANTSKLHSYLGV